ncbi:hypothetical protein OS493_000298 [Desmophyllum pertusum]|uniref:Uncharacterized protein n=1 Tax=Desmophyllum pertusum TaxID=174260 RepID=A0A9X0A6R9_9CNID|nr:hypothetical protein OS493_000298 [Desmophyllum pertusum]
MAKHLVIFVLMVIAFCAKDTHGQIDDDSKVGQYEIPRRVPELFPRTCGLHSWKNCARRRSSAIKKTVRPPKAILNLRNKNDFEDILEDK